jgi:hypothetical protein
MPAGAYSPFLGVEYYTNPSTRPVLTGSTGLWDHGGESQVPAILTIRTIFMLDGREGYISWRVLMAPRVRRQIGTFSFRK